LGFIKPTSFNEAFTKWIIGLIGNTKDKTLSLDGKTIRSTAKMQKYENPLHIVSAQLAETGVTIGQTTVDGKSNEIPAVQKLLEFLDISGCMVVADALNCQKETVKRVMEGGGDYLLCVKDNQQTLKQEIADYAADQALRGTMDKLTQTEKNRGRIETRTAYTTSEVDWLFGRDDWAGLSSIGAINTKTITGKGETNEWHYYISSRKLTAAELLDHARKEWSVESMHWLLDVHFLEDSCRATEQRTQENLNIIRKITLNILRLFKTASNSNAAFSHLMLECMIDPLHILKFCTLAGLAVN
jgi:predicted transposase YbfD/YdcC